GWASVSPALPLLEVQVPDLAGLAADEVAPRLDALAHERAEGLVRFAGVAHRDLEQRSRLRVHGGLPELIGVHLAQPLEALHADVLGPSLARELLDCLVTLLLVLGIARDLAGADPIQRR